MLLSRSPLTLLARGALQPEACAELIVMAQRHALSGPGGCAATLPSTGAVIEQLNACITALIPGAVPQTWQAHSYAPNHHDAFPHGLHVDTIGAPRRFLTALLYLTTPEGGETVFPLADCEPGELHSASPRLLTAGILHSRMADDSADASLLEASAGKSSAGTRVAPVAGDMLLFFTAEAAAVSGGVAVDPRLWHGGAAVRSGMKWTLQNFME
eukprot:2379-Prymnesium_polylepis.1